MSRRLLILNRQRGVPVNVPCLRRLARILLREFPGKNKHDLGIYVVGSSEMTRLNETYLQHEGSTDVITFDYADCPPAPARLHRLSETSPKVLNGEIFICADEAVAYARRYRITWQSELARYVIHGILHLSGYDDLHPRERRLMKREENRRLRELGRHLTLADLKRPSPARRKVSVLSRSTPTRRRFPLSKRSGDPKISV